MTSKAMIEAVRRGFRNAGWTSPTEDVVQQIAAEIERQILEGKANESVV
jgi:hypothetical protein